VEVLLILRSRGTTSSGAQLFQKAAEQGQLRLVRQFRLLSFKIKLGYEAANKGISILEHFLNAMVEVFAK
jgi:hypothetical protein